MTDTIVSIRMPSRLYEDIKKLISEKRFLDSSEAIRSVVRRKYTQFTILGTTRIEAIRDTLVVEKRERRRKELTRQIERLSFELKKMGDEIEHLQ